MRLDGIGDALACAPLVAALRDAGHQVSALLSTRNAGAFARRAFGSVHAVERIPWPRHGTTPETRRSAIAAIRASAYDVALIASEEVEAYAIAREAGIPQRVGFTNGWEKPMKTLVVRRLVSRALVRPASAMRVREHEVETLFRLGAGLVDESRPTRERERLRPLVIDAEPAPNGTVVLQLTAKFASSGLGLEVLAAVARSLQANGVAVASLADAAALAGEFTALGGPAPQSLDLEAWKNAIAGARAVVTPDSGAAHVAGMLGVPAVVLFPPIPQAPYDVVRWRPWLGPARTLIATEFAAGASDEQRRERFAQRVANELRSLLVSESVV